MAGGGWAAALAALPASLQPLPFHAASQFAHLFAAPPRRPRRLLEMLDQPDDAPSLRAACEALAMTDHTVTDRAALLTSRPPTGSAWDLIYLHPAAATREEFRRILARSETRLARDGRLWIVAIDPVFAPACLPPAGRTLPALSALWAELRQGGWQAAARSTRANFVVDILAARGAEPAAAGAWTTLAAHFAQGFPQPPLPPAAAACGIDAPWPTTAEQGLHPASPVCLHRGGLARPRQDAAGRWHRPVLPEAGRVLLSLWLPAAAQTGAAAEATPTTTFLPIAMRLELNPEAGPAQIAWLGTPSVRDESMAPSVGRPEAVANAGAGQVQHWQVAAPGGWLHCAIQADRLTQVYAIEVSRLERRTGMGDPTAQRLADLPRDMAARHRPVIERAAAAAAGLRILDVGGAPGVLAALLPQHRVTTVDTGHAVEHPDFLRLAQPAGTAGNEAFRLPFADSSFDLVVAIDVLEHIPADCRAAFVAECGRVAGQQLWLACPVASPAAQAAEAALAAALPERHDFLAEHHQFGLPTAAAVADYLTATGKPARAIAGGATVAAWLEATAADLGLKKTPALPADTQALAAATIYRQQWWWQVGQ